MNPQVIETQEEETRVEQHIPKKVVKTTTTVVPPSSPIGEEPPQKVYKTKKAIFHTYQVLWYLLGVIEVVLTFRLLLKLLGADPTSGFADFIYTISNPFAVPFLGVVKASFSGNSILEWSTGIAMAVYWIIVWGIIEFLQLVKPVSPDEVEQTVDSA